VKYNKIEIRINNVFNKMIGHNLFTVLPKKWAFKKVKVGLFDVYYVNKDKGDLF